MTYLSIYYNIPIQFESASLKNVKLFFLSFINSYSYRSSYLELSTILLIFYFIKDIKTAQIYHFIRLQSLVKIYVIFGFLDVCDKIITTIIGDVITSLYNCRFEIDKTDNNI
ncbi:hypothetical protein COBT_003081, partial [Conglomerata obtusa]